MTPRPYRLARLLVAGVTTAALAAPPAVARPIENRPAPVPRDAGTTVAVTPEPAPADAPIVVRPVDTGFDWDSAAIGGGTGALVVLVSIGGFAYASRRRFRVTS